MDTLRARFGPNNFNDDDCANRDYSVNGLRLAGNQLFWNVPFAGASISCACLRQ